uniref:Uncharacterized protein n=1 Tax=viral metagenome TaxID=1070528 RepID=A0A6M3J510_9ZZZZ
MAIPIQGQNKGELRRSIGRNLGIVTIGAITAVPGTPDTTSVIDTTNLTGGDDEHNGKQVMIYDATGSIVDGETRRVTDYLGSASDATTTAFSANTAVGDKYEMCDTPWLIADIDDAINQAIMAVTKDCLQVKETETTWTADKVKEYDCLSGFVGLHKVEYVSSVGVEVILDTCDTAWTAGSANVTVTADTSFKKEGTASAKLVEDGNSAAGAILGYATISSADISDCDALEFWLYSSIALTAGQLDFALDNTAAIASPIESLDVPATTAATWTRHVVSLANPQSDTAIISLGIVNTSDVGACTLYIDDVKAVKKGSRVYKTLNPQYWTIARGSTNYLQLNESGKSVTGDNTLLRLSGYQLPALLSDDTTDSEIDPTYIIEQTTGWLAIGHAKSSRLQIKDRASFSKYHLGLAEAIKPSLRSTIFPDTRMI